MTAGLPEPSNTSPPGDDGCEAVVSVPEKPKRRRSPAPSGKARDTFLDAMRSGWSVTHAAKEAGHDRQRFYELRRDDEAFAAAWAEADEEGADHLEDELTRRAREGWTEDTTAGDGSLMRRVQRYSPALLVKVLESKRPEKYRDRTDHLQVDAQVHGRLETGMTPEQTDALEGFLAAMHRLATRATTWEEEANVIEAGDESAQLNERNPDG